MEEANEKKTSTGLERLSLQTNRFPRDLLQSLVASGPNEFGFANTTSNEDGSEEIELNLGLSLGGRFGVDKSDEKRLMRSSSIAGSIPIVRDDDAVASRPPVPYPTLVRTSSLPAESEHEWRKRKELQTLRRMEAKRRRCEKQRSLKVDKDVSGGGFEEERREIERILRGRIEREPYMATANKFGSSAVPVRLPSWAAAARQGIVSGGIEAAAAAAKGKGNFMGGGGGVEGIGQPSSQGSMESQGGSSSGMSELESNKPLQGSSSFGEASPASLHSFQERCNPDTAGSSGTKAKETDSRIASPSKRPNVAENKGREAGAKAIEDMPCVFTKGDGPNGRRIDGILYQYGKGEEVRIMCVCHGIFLSPAEFVKHAGGSDVAHPLKHIVVNPSSSFL